MPSWISSKHQPCFWFQCFLHKRIVPVSTFFHVLGQSINWNDTSITREYGAYTGTTSLALVSSQPRYIIELLSTLPASPGQSIATGINRHPAPWLTAFQRWALEEDLNLVSSCKVCLSKSDTVR